MELYQTTFGAQWFAAARELAETMPEHFADSQGILYDTGDDHGTLIAHPRDLQDIATPEAISESAAAPLSGGLIPYQGFAGCLVG